MYFPYPIFNSQSSKSLVVIFTLFCLITTSMSLLAQGDTIPDNIFKTKKFRTGIFKTWEEFKTNQPSITGGFTTVPATKFDASISPVRVDTGRIIPNQVVPDQVMHMGIILKDAAGHKIRDAFAVYDGDALYINSSMYQSMSNLYWRVLDAGEIMYFRDPRMNSLNALVTGVIAGPPGIVFGEAVSTRQPDGVMVFSHDDGDTFEVDQGSLESVFEEYDPELLKLFRREPDRKDGAVLQKYVILYNRRHIQD